MQGTRTEVAVDVLPLARELPPDDCEARKEVVCKLSQVVLEDQGLRPSRLLQHLQCSAMRKGAADRLTCEARVEGAC